MGINEKGRFTLLDVDRGNDNLKTSPMHDPKLLRLQPEEEKIEELHEIGNSDEIEEDSEEDEDLIELEEM